MSDASELPSALPELARRCREETERFFRRLAPDTRFCFELFRRALARRDDAAFDHLIRNYTPLVDGWVRGNAGFPTTGEEASVFVAAAFEKLWQAVPPARFTAFPDLKALLRYLKLCAGSSVIDYLRGRDDHASLDDEGCGPLAEPAASEPRLSRVERAELWTAVLARAQNEEERVVVFASLAQAMKPADVMREYPGVFATVNELYRVKQNLLERLSRDQSLRAYLAPYA